MSGDRRGYSPRAQFWFWIGLSTFAGIAVGTVSFYGTFDLYWPSVLAGVTGSLIGASLGVWLARDRYRSVPAWVEPYYHPVLGVWLAFPALVVSLLLTEDPVRAMIFAAIGGIGWSLAMLFARLWRTRDDPPGTSRPVPTITGWREAADKP